MVAFAFETIPNKVVFAQWTAKLLDTIRHDLLLGSIASGTLTKEGISLSELAICALRGAFFITIGRVFQKLSGVVILAFFSLLFVALLLLQLLKLVGVDALDSFATFFVERYDLGLVSFAH